ncbi:MAG: hypothetical protein MUD12_15700 [Spirochaetes bacterium]|jgi:hypothetical protein|nr:hypothetical protein [Spirochaetota bacterium]
MLKKSFLVIGLAISAAMAYADDIASVIGKKYYDSNGYIEFKKDNTYESNHAAPGLNWHDKGKYNIKNNKVYLEAGVCKEFKENRDNMPCDETFGSGECTVINDNESLFFTKFLKCISYNKNVSGFKSLEIIFPMPEFKVKPGEERVHGEIKVIVLIGSTGVTTSNVKIRQSPGINSESIKYIDGINFINQTAKTYDFVPKGKKITIIARTKEKDKVEKWNNYWYLISVGENNGVWIYGEFIKIK